MRKINTFDIEEIVSIVASSDGDLNLAAERLAKKEDGKFGDVTESELKARIAQMDLQSSDMLASRFRTLLTVRLYELIYLVTNQLVFELGSLKPAELARTNASLINSFASLTMPATKVTFDFEAELRRLAEEFPDVPIEDMRGEINAMQEKTKNKNGMKLRGNGAVR